MIRTSNRTGATRLICQIGIGLIAASTLSACADPESSNSQAGDGQVTETTTATSESATEEVVTEEPTPEPEPDPAEDLKNAISDEVKDSTTEIVDGLVTVNFTISNGIFSSGPSTLSARGDTKDIIALVKDSPWSSSTITVTANSILVDPYGNENEREVLRVTYLPETVSKINIENIANHNVWGVADDSFVHPAIGGF